VVDMAAFLSNIFMIRLALGAPVNET